MQLVRIVYRLLKGLDSGRVIVNCYYDLSKAFDRVWYEGFLIKFAYIGVRGTVFVWFRLYFIGRRQRVRVGDMMLVWEDISVGVSQGFVFGSLLFFIYIYDLLVVVIQVDIECAQFVDDTVLLIVVQFFVEVGSGLQQLVICIIRWFGYWCLLVNKEKIVIMEILRRYLSYNYKIDFDGSIFL